MFKSDLYHTFDFRDDEKINVLEQFAYHFMFFDAKVIKIEINITQENLLHSQAPVLYFVQGRDLLMLLQ